MATGRTNVGGGLNINGIIEQYQVAAGENINAGDFVDFVNSGIYKAGTDKQLSTTTYSGLEISTVLLSNGNVFIAHSNTSNSARYLYGMVVTIDGTTITAGTDTQLSTTSYSGYKIRMILLPNGDVFIAHSGGNYPLYGMVVTIDGTTITVGADTRLSTDSYSGYEISTVLLPNGNVFIAHSGSYTYCLYGIVVTIDGTTITAGTDTQLSTESYSGYVISVILLPNGDVFIAHSNTSSTYYYLYGMVVTIDGTTITAGADTQLSTVTYSGRKISAVLLPNGNIFIAHSSDSGNYYLYGMVVTIDGTTIAAGTDTQLSTVTYSGYTISVILLPNGDVFIAHSNTSSTYYYLYGMVVTIDGTTITAGTDTQLSTTTYSGFTISTVLLSNADMLIAHSNTSSSARHLYGMIRIAVKAAAVSHGSTANGVAKAKGTDGATIDVFVPA